MFTSTIAINATEITNGATIIAHGFAISGVRITAEDLALEVAKVETHESLVSEFAAEVLPLISELYDDAKWFDALTLQWAYATNQKAADYINGLTAAAF